MSSSVLFASAILISLLLKYNIYVPLCTTNLSKAFFPLDLTDPLKQWWSNYGPPRGFVRPTEACNKLEQKIYQQPCARL